MSGAGVARGLRLVAALPVYVLYCLAQTVATTLLAGFAWLSIDSFVLLAAAFAAAALWPRPTRWRSGRAASPRAKLGFGAVLVGLAVFLATRPDPAEINAFALVLLAFALLAWGNHFRHRVGDDVRPVGLVESALWPLAFVLVATVLSVATIPATLVLMLWRHAALLSRLSRGPMRWPELAVAGALLAFVVVPFRGSFEATPTACKPATSAGHPDAFWIAALGDSSTYGIFLPDRLTYPALLERAFATEGDRAPVRVANCAFSGAASWHLETQLAAARAVSARIAILYIGDNDTLRPTGTPLAEVRTAYLANVRNAIASARASGMVPVLLTVPYGTYSPGDAKAMLAEASHLLAREEDVAVVDLAPDMGTWPRAAFYFIADFVHPNEPGHALIARRLHEALAPLVPPSGRP